MKRCCICGEFKPFTDFNIMRKGKDGHQPRCRICQRALQAEYRATHRLELNRKSVEYQRANPWKRQTNHLLTKYGIRREDVDLILAEQGGCCPVCGGTEPRGRGWHVDHDHDCCPGQKTCRNCIRGILCGVCNLMMGFSGDNPEILRSAANYLEAYKRSLRDRQETRTPSDLVDSSG